MEDHVGPLGDEACRDAGVGEIGGLRLDLAGETLGFVGGDDIDKREALDGPAAQRPSLTRPQ